jgi:hypothetical protein
LAIYHLSVKIIGRSSGRSAVAAAAYRAGARMTDERTGAVSDYSKKPVSGGAVLLAEGAPPEWADRERLWNAAEAAERRRDARTAREIEVALPVELGEEGQAELARSFALEALVAEGMCADVALHGLGGANPHAHIMATTRRAGPGGFGAKERAWDSRGMVLRLREGWARACNDALGAAGSPERVDHRSLAAQGSDREPGIHVGPAARAMEARGARSDRAEIGRGIAARNAEAGRLRDEARALEAERASAARGRRAELESEHSRLAARAAVLSAALATASAERSSAHRGLSAAQSREREAAALEARLAAARGRRGRGARREADSLRERLEASRRALPGPAGAWSARALARVRTARADAAGIGGELSKARAGMRAAELEHKALRVVEGMHPEWPGERRSGAWGIWKSAITESDARLIAARPELSGEESRLVAEAAEREREREMERGRAR